MEKTDRDPAAVLRSMGRETLEELENLLLEEDIKLDVLLFRDEEGRQKTWRPA